MKGVFLCMMRHVCASGYNICYILPTGGTPPHFLPLFEQAIPVQVKEHTGGDEYLFSSGHNA